MEWRGFGSFGEAMEVPIYTSKGPTPMEENVGNRGEMERMSACPRVAATARRSASACRASSHDQASRATQGRCCWIEIDGRRVARAVAKAGGVPNARSLRTCRVAASHSARFHVLLGGVEEEDHATRIVGRAVLAYIAAEMGSFVFLKELVAVVHRAYDDGVPLLRLKVEAAALNMESGFVEPVFTQQQLEIFTSWMAIIYVTIALRTGGSERNNLVDRSDRQIQGVYSFVESTLEVLGQGYDLERLQLQQSFARAEEKDILPESSPAMELMRQNTRLILLTASMTNACQSELLEDEGSHVRSLAMQLLAGFIGAVSGSEHCLRCFARSALIAYRSNVPVSALCEALDTTEFAQDGDVIPVGLSRDSSSVYLKLSLFARWLTVSYLAQESDLSDDLLEFEDAFWQGDKSVEKVTSLEAERQGILQFVRNAVKEDWDSENTGKMEAFERSISNPFLEADSPTVLFMRQQATLAILARDFGRGTGQ